MSRNTRIVIVILLLVAVFVGWRIGIQVSRMGLDAITLQTVPSDSTVTMNGKKIDPNGKIYVKRGVYTLKATRKYFDSVSKKIDTKNTGNKTIYLMPVPNSQAALDWLSNHPEEQKIREAVAGQQEAEIRKALETKNPVITKLPVFNSHYKIDYSIGQKNELRYSVTLYPIINGPSQYAQYQQQLAQYKAEALEFLVANGVNTSTAEISFNPTD